MARDPIEEFMKNYGRLYDRLEPRDQSFVTDRLTQEMDQLRTRPMAGEKEGAIGAAVAHDVQVWKEMVSESRGNEAANVALDRSKQPHEPAQALPEVEKQEAVKDFGHVIDAQEAREATWAQRVEDGFRASLFEGHGHTDEKMVRSAGQYANSWSEAVRPEKTPQDFQAALKSMGIEQAAERQATQEKSMDKGQEHGGEGIEY